MATPTKNSIMGKFINGRNAQDDFLHLVENHSGNVFGWIDYTGTPQGTLATGGAVGLPTGQIAFGSVTNTVTGSSNFTFDPTIGLDINVDLSTTPFDDGPVGWNMNVLLPGGSPAPAKSVAGLLVSSIVGNTTIGNASNDTEIDGVNVFVYPNDATSSKLVLRGYVAYVSGTAANNSDVIEADGFYNNLLGSSSTVGSTSAFRAAGDMSGFNVHGLLVEDIVDGQNNCHATNIWAIKTGLGKVEFGDVVVCDSTINGLVTPSPSGATTPTFAQTVAPSGTQVLGTTLITSGGKSTVISTAVLGVLATDNIIADFNTDPSGVTGYAPSASGMLTIIKWCSAGHINFYQYNNTGSSITPGAMTLNYLVVR